MFCSTTIINQQKHFPMKCVLGICPDCLTYFHHPIEFATNSSKENTIRYQHYVMRSICKLHGNFSSELMERPVCTTLPEDSRARVYQKKFRTCTTTTIGTFFKDHYIPLMLNKYKYHYPHILMLGKSGVGNERQAAYCDDPNAFFTKKILQKQ